MHQTTPVSVFVHLHHREKCVGELDGQALQDLCNAGKII